LRSATGLSLTLGSPVLRVLLMNRAGIHDWLRAPVAGRHEDEVAHHGGLSLLVELHDPLCESCVNAISTMPTAPSTKVWGAAVDGQAHRCNIAAGISAK
jgi:hypothetical protein